MSVGLGQTELQSLAAWLSDNGIPTVGPLTVRLIAGGRSNLTYELTDELHRWVLRRPPLGGYTPSAHDVEREYRVTKALERTAVPVARTVAASDSSAVIGTPFTIVEFVSGSAVRTREELESMTGETIDRLVDGLLNALALLHRVDHVAVGLGDFGPTGGYAVRQLRRWSRQWELVGAEAGGSAVGTAAAALHRFGESVPTQTTAAVVHGDYRIDNTIIDPDSGRVRAIVDWELSTIGDPVADVALMCVYRESALDSILGFPAAWTSDLLPTADQLAARYEAIAGVGLSNWEFWMGISAFKLAVIAAGIDHRWRSGATVGVGYDSASQAVEPLMEMALRFAKLAEA
jgi:aminoglycoside phosphotransferase (APT) family kinase protein